MLRSANSPHFSELFPLFAAADSGTGTNSFCYLWGSAGQPTLRLAFGKFLTVKAEISKWQLLHRGERGAVMEKEMSVKKISQQIVILFFKNVWALNELEVVLRRKDNTRRGGKLSRKEKNFGTWHQNSKSRGIVGARGARLQYYTTSPATVNILKEKSC